MIKQNKEKNRCPLCGELNQCESEMSEIMGAGRDVPCWCRIEVFPVALLAALPEEEQNSRCICLSCLKAFDAGQSKS
jgi:hypothetical protein